MGIVVGDLREPLRGRGTFGNPTNRFESTDYVNEEEVEEAVRPATVYLDDHAKSILSRNDSPDVGFDVGINPYRGCEHGCVYCFARPMHEYLGFSAGLDFETRIMVKRAAPALLREALRKKSWVPQPIGLSGATDAYQPIERELELTRGCLEVLAEARNPAAVITKNRLVTRDIDVLQELAKHRAAVVFISLTTLDLKLNRLMEPRTSSPGQRLEAMSALSEAGIPVGVLTAPVIPGLNDHELPELLKAAAGAGAKQAGYVLLRLPHAVAPLFERWLEQHFPMRKEKVLNRLRSLRGGQLYQSDFGERMRGTGPYAEHIQTLFEVARRKAGLERHGFSLSADAFRRPSSPGDQLSLV
jgi:DNA repair photolyase